jgi:hypothetical protein
MTVIANNDYYECHITLDAGYNNLVKPIADVGRFKFSALKGDEFMGDDVKIYLTAHDKTEDGMRTKMSIMTNLLALAKIPFVRRKIEHIIFDERDVK